MANDYRTDPDMARTELLHKAIKAQYKTIRKFSIELGVPYHIVQKILKGDINQASYGLIARMCEMLKLDMYTMKPASAVLTTELLKTKFLREFTKLNDRGKRRVIELTLDLVQLEPYTSVHKPEMEQMKDISNYYNPKEKKQ